MNSVFRLDLISAFILFGILQGILLAGVFFFQRQRTFVFFGLLVLVLAIIGTESFLLYSGAARWFPWMINVSPTFVLLLGPLSYLYCVSAHEKKETLYSYRWVHFIPGLFYFLYSFFFFLQSEDFKISSVQLVGQSGILEKRIIPSFPVDPLNVQGLVVIEGLAIHLLSYGVLGVWMGLYRKPFSWAKLNVHAQGSLVWSAALIIGGLLFLSTGGIVNGRRFFEPLLPEYVVNLYTVILVYAMSAFWLSRLVVTGKGKGRYSKSLLPQAIQTNKLSLLQDIMATQRPYKAQDFSLGQLALLANLSTHQVSQILNVGLGTSFHEFVNQYRIAEAQEILKRVGNPMRKLEPLAHELGYKSKSAFFIAFKKQTNMTPLRYREVMLKSENQFFPIEKNRETRLSSS